MFNIIIFKKNNKIKFLSITLKVINLFDFLIHKNFDKKIIPLKKKKKIKTYPEKIHLIVIFI